MDDKGKLQLPADMDIVTKELIRQAKRTRDGQSELSRSQTSNRNLTAANEVLKGQALSMVPEDFQLSDDELTALNTLKFRDPDAYRLKVNELEKNARAAQETKLGELTTTAANKANETFIAKDRITVLEEFKVANPTIQLTDDILVNDVPQRFMKDLNAGKYDYQTYLTKVTEYLVTAKVLPSQKGGDEHNLGDIAGGHTPGKKAAENAGNKDYAKITF